MYLTWIIIASILFVISIIAFIVCICIFYNYKDRTNYEKENARDAQVAMKIVLVVFLTSFIWPIWLAILPVWFGYLGVKVLRTNLDEDN